MVRRQTVLVLGAGASVSVGYPIGAVLRTRLIDLTGNAYRDLLEVSGLSQHAGEITRFVEEFETSQLNSIDAFLARRAEYSDIGKKAVAALLLSCERRDHLFRSVSDDHWYKYLLNAFAADTWEAIDFSRLTIVTFNYDRSLEHYLLFALGAAYGKTQEEVLQKLASLNILHCYGSLGPTLPNREGYRAYGDPVSAESVAAAAECIQVLPEGRGDSTTFQLARDSLYFAEAIAFLGFGFDSMNTARLESSRTCRGVMNDRDGRVVPRMVAATCLGMTPVERERVRSETAGAGGGTLPHTTHLGSKLIDTYMDTNCLHLLRSTLILDGIA